MCEVMSKKKQQKTTKKKRIMVNNKKKWIVMNPIWCQMKKCNPSNEQNDQLVHWRLLVHSGPIDQGLYYQLLKMCCKECTLTNVLNLSALGVSKNFSENLMRYKKDIWTPLVSVTCHIMYMAYYIARYIHIKVWGGRLCHFLDHII
jgi:hypothetical protein